MPNAEIDNLEQELIKKNDEHAKQQDEILRLSYEVEIIVIILSKYIHYDLDARNSSSIT